MADPSVFTKSHDEVTGMLGSTLDFIGQESARSIEYQRYRQFQEQEAEKERGFKAEQEKLKSDREIQLNAFTSYLDNLDKLGPKGRAARQEALSGAIKNPDQLAAIMDRNPDILGMGVDVKEQLTKNPGLSQFVPAGIQTLTVPEWEEVMKNYHAYRNILAAKDDNEKRLAIQNYGEVVGNYMKRLNADTETLTMFGIPTGEVDEKGNPIYDSEGVGEIATRLFEDKQNQYARISEYLAKGQIPPADVTQTFWSQGDIQSQAKEYQRQIKHGRAEEEASKAKGRVMALNREEAELQREKAELEKYLETEKPGLKFWEWSDKAKRLKSAKKRLSDIQKEIKNLTAKGTELDADVSGKEAEAKKWEPKKPPKTKKDGLDLFPDR